MGGDEVGRVDYGFLNGREASQSSTINSMKVGVHGELRRQVGGARVLRSVLGLLLIWASYSAATVRYYYLAGSEAVGSGVWDAMLRGPGASSSPVRELGAHLFTTPLYHPSLPPCKRTAHTVSFAPGRLGHCTSRRPLRVPSPCPHFPSPPRPAPRPVP